MVDFFIDFDAMRHALEILSGAWEAWLVVIPGLLLGLISAAIPGMSGAVAMAVVLPLTPFMDFLSAVLLLTSIFTGSGFGGAIPAVLINVPGQTPALATTFDGYPMARAGRHNEALGLALAASCVGAGLSYVALTLFIAPMANTVLLLGPTEMLFVGLWGLTLIAAVRGRYLARGLLACVFGVMLGSVGTGLMGDVRGTMGIDHLLDGIPILPALIGLFAAVEMYRMSNEDYIVADETARRLDFGRILAGVAMAFRYPVVLLRGSLIGAAIGAVPGVGSSVANLISYAAVRRRARDPESFGRGNPMGVVAAESANSSSEGGSMTTLLALGIPGGIGTAILLAAFSMHNITGGPRFFIDHKDVVYAILFANLAQAVILFGIGLGVVHLASAVVRVPIRYLAPTVLAFTVVGAFFITGNMAGPVAVVVFSVIGWFMRMYDYPVTATIVGLLLGRFVEAEAVRTIQISRGDPGYILTRPLTLLLAVLILASLASPMIARRLRARRAQRGARKGA